MQTAYAIISLYLQYCFFNKKEDFIRKHLEWIEVKYLMLFSLCAEYNT